MREAGVNAGRGVLFIALAKLYFMVAGYVVYFTLPRLLDKAAWGNFQIVTGLASVINNVIVTVTIQGVSRFTAQGGTTPDAVKRSALKVQSLLGGGVTLLFLLASEQIANWEEDASLARLYRISAGIVLCYSFYAVFVGSLNGLNRFGRQAFLDTLFATLRVAAIIACTAMGLGVAGAITGWVGAAAVILVFAAWWVGLPRGSDSFSPRRLWSFMGQLFVYTFALNLMMRADLFLIKRHAGELVRGSSLLKAAFASEAASYYGTAQSLAFIPYQAVLAVAFVIFPLVSRATFEQDHAATRAYIHQTLRLSLVFVAGLAVVLVANPEAVIGLPYPADYRLGGPALRALAPGMVCFAMLTIVNTILNGAGRTRRTIVAAVLTLLAVVASNHFAVRAARTEAQVLLYPALATATSLAFGFILSVALLRRALRTTLPLSTLLRMVVAASLATALGIWIPEVSKLVTLFECVLVFAVYWVVLVLTGEFNAEDVAKLKRILRRR